MESFIVQMWGYVFKKVSHFSSPINLFFFFFPTLRTWGAIDLWVLSNSGFAILSLFLISYVSHSIIIVLLLGYSVVRIIEVVSYQAMVVFFDPLRSPRATKDYAVRGHRRLVLLGLHNYLEITIWFANIYCFFRSSFGPHPEILATPYGAWYYSLVTMTTLGYGDVTPTTDFARIIVSLHLLVTIFITIILLARFVSNLPVPRSLDEAEQNMHETHAAAAHNKQNNAAGK